MTLTPRQLAALDQARAESEAELDERVAELRAAVDGLGPHEATALLQAEYARMPADTARLVLAVFMHRIIRLTSEVARAHAAGYAEAVARLRDDERYRNWWSSPGNERPDAPVRRHLADYLEAVGAEGQPVT